jgi:hypothetical protein
MEVHHPQSEETFQSYFLYNVNELVKLKKQDDLTTYMKIKGTI